MENKKRFFWTLVSISANLVFLLTLFFPSELVSDERFTYRAFGFPGRYLNVYVHTSPEELPWWRYSGVSVDLLYLIANVVVVSAVLAAVYWAGKWAVKGIKAFWSVKVRDRRSSRVAQSGKEC